MHRNYLIQLSTETIKNAHPTLQKATDYAQNIEWEFFLAEG